MEFYIDKNVQQYAIYHKDEIVHGWKLMIWARYKKMDKSGSMKMNVVNHGSSFWSFYKCYPITL
jgi:hypothetical protein